MVNMMTTCDLDCPDCCCPFADTEASMKVEGYGCLPDRWEITRMRVNHGKTWACHSDPTQPCLGAIRSLKEQGLPYKVIDPVLITEQDDWGAYCEYKE